MNKRIFLSTICIMIVLSNLITIRGVAFTPPASYEISANAYILVCMDNNMVVAQKNADEKIYPAALTSLMTAVVVFEKVEDLSKPVTTSLYAIQAIQGTGALGCDLKEGEIMTVFDQLNRLLISSSADAATTLAEYVGTTLSGFTLLMNEKAAELGMSNTNFANAHGLHNDNHYTTVNDLLILTNYLLKFEKLVEICNTKRYTIPATNKSPSRLLATTNYLIDPSTDYYYRYASGIRTGFTDPAGRCIISTAEKNSVSYLCIVMGSQIKDSKGRTNRYELFDIKNLFDWAFNELKYTQLVELNIPLAEMPVTLSTSTDFVQLVAETSISSIIPTNSVSSIIYEPHLTSESIEAPVKAGAVLGYVDIFCAGEYVGKVNLVAASSLERSNISYLVSQITKFLSSMFFLGLLGAVLLFVFVFIIILIVINRKNRKSKRAHSYRRL